MGPNLAGQAPNANKPADRQGKVLFINADAEFHAGRAQNYLRPEHVEKIVSTFDRYQDIPGYARVVPLSELASEANDFNLNIRRYVDNSPPPEPHDVRAHLLGGVPVAEVNDKRALFASLGFDPLRLFVPRKLVRRTMTDYLERIAAAKADIARLKGEKEAFEQSNAPEDLDEEELENWNYPKDVERQIRELKTEHKNALKELAKLEKAAAKPTKGGRGAPSAPSPQVGRSTPCAPSQELLAARKTTQPVLDQLAALAAALVPYEAIKEKLSEARSRFHSLTDEFVNELKSRCDAKSDDQKRALVLELFAQDVQAGLDSALAEKRQELVRFIEELWDKYRVTLTDLRTERTAAEQHLAGFLKEVGYA